MLIEMSSCSSRIEHGNALHPYEIIDGLHYFQFQFFRGLEAAKGIPCLISLDPSEKLLLLRIFWTFLLKTKNRQTSTACLIKLLFSCRKARGGGYGAITGAKDADVDVTGTHPFQTGSL